MLKILQRFTGSLFTLLSPAARREQQSAQQALQQRRKEILIAELSQEKLSGKPVAYRRLDSLMLAAGTTRRETVSLLKQMGARPSRRRGKQLWTLK